MYFNGMLVAKSKSAVHEPQSNLSQVVKFWSESIIFFRSAPSDANENKRE